MLLFSSFHLLLAQDSVSDRIGEMEKSDGYFPFYWDAEKGKIYLGVNKLDTEFLYYTTLAAGAGSNDIGLDRGRLGRPSGPSASVSQKKSMVAPDDRNLSSACRWCMR